MLVLTRKICESIVIGNSTKAEQLITITVLEIRGGRVRLGFEMPGDVAVHRSEVWHRVNATNASEVAALELEMSAT